MPSLIPPALETQEIKLGSWPEALVFTHYCNKYQTAASFNYGQAQ